jgi:ribose transport system substrate-binding protein
MSVMEDMLQAHRDLNGVFGINDDSALGALSVLDAAHRTDIAIVGYDATDEAQAAMRKGGALKAEVIQHPKTIGTTAMGVVARYLKGEQVPSLVSVDVGILTAEAVSRR